MVAEHRKPNAEDLAEFDVEDRLYHEMMEHHHQEWYAIASGRLYRSPDVHEVDRMLKQAGLDPRMVGVHFMPHGPPYYV